MEVQAATVASGSCGENLTWKLDDKGTLTISGTGEMNKYIAGDIVVDSVPWEDYLLKIKKVVIKDGVTSISGGAFEGCKVLKTVSLPSTLVSIGSYAFRNCHTLSSIDFPASLTTIYGYAFSNCNALTKVTIPATLTNMSYGVFRDCDGLKKVVFEDGVVNIPGYIFSECSKLEEVVLPKGVKTIGSETFAYCSSLKSITIPASVTKIDDMAFYQCTGLSAVYITDLEAWCNIEFVFDWSDGSNPMTWGNADLYLNGKVVKDLSIPKSIKNINPYAFYGCESITSLTIPSTTTVGKGAFQGCDHLETVTFAKGTEVIPHSIFAGCDVLSTVNIPTSVTVVDNNAFYENKGLNKVVYNGSEKQWNEIVILDGNDSLKNAYAITNCTHKWDSGYISESPNCKTEGIKTFTCTVCNGTKTEKIAKTNDHSFGSWTKVNDKTHKHTCSYCQTEETAKHNWDSGKVTKEASCKNDGVKTYTCQSCSAKKTEAIPQLDTHIYDNACDTTCNYCDVTRTTSHSYSSQWSSDKTSHWHKCTSCGDKKDVEKHTPGEEATEFSPQLCTTCGYELKAALAHSHSYSETWTTNDTTHWRECACGLKGYISKHTWVRNFCSFCGMQDPATVTEPTTEPTTVPTTEPTTAPTTEPTIQPTTEPTTAPTTTEPTTQTVPERPTEPSDSSKGSNAGDWIAVVFASSVISAVGGFLLGRKKR